MSTSASSVRSRPVATEVRVDEEHLTVCLEDGRVVSVPLVWFPKLLKATPRQRADFRLIGRGVGIHWGELDEDISVEGLLRR